MMDTAARFRGACVNVIALRNTTHSLLSLVTNAPSQYVFLARACRWHDGGLSMYQIHSLYFIGQMVTSQLTAGLSNHWKKAL